MHHAIHCHLLEPDVYHATSVAQPRALTGMRQVIPPQSRDTMPLYMPILVSVRSHRGYNILGINLQVIQCILNF